MRSHLLIRITAVTAMLAGLTGGAVVTASPASAIGGGGTCTSTQRVSDFGVSSTSPQYVYADLYDQCIPGPGETLYTVEIYKYIGGVGYEWVATGKGHVTYTCTGGRSLYTTSNNAGAGFYCG